MQLTIQDVAKFFNVPERTIYRWINQNYIPVYQVNDQYRFNKSELIEWASAKKLEVYPEFFSSDEEDLPLPTLTESLKSGGIYYKVPGLDKESVLHNMVNLMQLPQEVNRDFICQILMAREKMASTGVGDGIAIPHVRNPVILNITDPIVNLCLLENPVDFGALDGNPVHVLFTLICPTPRVHLHLISRLAFVLHSQDFKALVLRHGSQEEILQGIEKAETKLCKSKTDTGAQH